MPRTRIKICGINNIDSARAATKAGADCIGLVFVKKSPRYVSIKQAKQIVNSLPPFVEPVGLFVDSTKEQIINIAQTVGLRTVQLHGKETPQFAENLKPLRVLKMVHFDDNFESNLNTWIEAKNKITNLSAILIDTPPTKDALLPGGSGRAVNWEALKQALQNISIGNGIPPIILAGGLNAKNVSQAISLVEPYAVDVSSGVESAPGVKDIKKIKDFCKAAQSR